MAMLKVPNSIFNSAVSFDFLPINFLVSDLSDVSNNKTQIGYVNSGHLITGVDFEFGNSFGSPTLVSGTITKIEYKSDFVLSDISIDVKILRDMFENNLDYKGYIFKGNDILVGGGGRDLLRGYVGDDSMVGGGGDDTLQGGEGADTVSGGLGNDAIDGGEGQSYLRGDEGDDRIVGGSGFDDLNGNMGNDTVVGGAGEDWVLGGKDNDSLSGGDAYDLVYGNIGNDTCDGGAGNDIVRGGQDDDVIRGGAGDDFVSGDKGSDTVSGGAGADIFHTFGDAGLDRVLDFSAAEGDRVQLDPGTQYTLSQDVFDTVVIMEGGGRMVLVGVQLSSLPAGWIFGA